MMRGYSEDVITYFLEQCRQRHLIVDQKLRTWGSPAEQGVGRGHASFDRESESRAFPTVSLAESYWSSRYPDAPVIRHW